MAEPLPPTVRRVAWLHFANDFTLDFLTPLLPLGVPSAWLGAMESAADGVAQILKLVTGRRSDATGVRTPWVRAGYLINALSRPLAAAGMLFAWPLWIVACRVGDRVGKGVRGSATDALVGDWTQGDQRAKAFATMRTLDHIGATAGALVAAAVVWRWPHQAAWAIAALIVPALIMAWWARGLRDAPDAKPKEGTAPAGWWPRDRGLQAPLFLLGWSSLGQAKPLLVLVAALGITLEPGKEGAWPAWALCLFWAALAATQAVAAAVAGALTVRLGARAFLALGWLAGALVFAALACLHGPALVGAGLGYGVLAGFTEGAEKTWLADLAPKSERALAYGAYGLLAAAGGIIGNTALGWALVHVGAVVFAAPAVVLAVAGLLALLPRRPAGVAASG